MPTEPRFHYLSPLILPVLPMHAGDTVFSMNLVSVLADVGVGQADAWLQCHIVQFERGAAVREETQSVALRDGVLEVERLERRFAGSDFGYAQVSIVADRPMFRKILTEHVYSFVVRPDGGNFILNASFKYSDPLIVDLMRRVGRFCLVHPAHFVDCGRRIGNSTLIVNPFDGPIVARLATASGARMSRRIEARHAALIDLSELIEDGKETCVLYTGNNRYPAWDVRHVYANGMVINRIDHLEFYRSDSTLRRVTPTGLARSKVRSLFEATGLRT